MSLGLLLSTMLLLVRAKHCRRPLQRTPQRHSLPRLPQLKPYWPPRRLVVLQRQLPLSLMLFQEKFRGGETLVVHAMLLRFERSVCAFYDAIWQLTLPLPRRLSPALRGATRRAPRSGAGICRGRGY